MLGSGGALARLLIALEGLDAGDPLALGRLEQRLQFGDARRARGCAFLGAAALLRHRQTHRLLPLLDQAPFALLKLPGELAVAYLAHDLRITRLVNLKHRPALGALDLVHARSSFASKRFYPIAKRATDPLSVQTKTSNALSWLQRAKPALGAPSERRGPHPTRRPPQRKAHAELDALRPFAPTPGRTRMPCAARTDPLHPESDDGRFRAATDADGAGLLFQNV